MNDLINFSYDGNQVRTINKNGEPWFVLKDVSEILGVQNHKDISARLDPDEKGVDSIDTLGGTQNMVTINESGLYNVILRSDKPEAKQFRKWVTSDVLPTIRKHGMYATAPTLDAMLADPDTAIRLFSQLKNERTARIAAEATVAAQAPKVLFADSVAGSHDCINVGTLAKLLKQNGHEIGEVRLYEWLRTNGYVIREKGRSYNRPTQRSMELGIMSVRESTRISPRGNTHIDAVTLITGKGQQYFIQKFNEAARLVEA